MKNEQIKSSQEDEKIFRPEDMQNKSHAEQMIQIDGAMSCLDLASENVENVLLQSELERNGDRDVQELVDRSSIFKRASLGVDKILGRRKTYDRKVTELAKQMTDKSLDKLERGLGENLIEAKKKLADHEATAQNDLETVRGLLSPEKFSEMENKMNKEKERLMEDKNEKETELQEKTAEYPAKEKYEKIENLLGEYGNIESTIKEKQSSLDSEIKNYESAFKKIKGTGEVSQELKEELQKKMDVLNRQRKEIESRGKEVKERIELLKRNQEELNPYIKRLGSIGKTKTEILEEEKAKLKNQEKPEENQEKPKEKQKKEGTKKSQTTKKTRETRKSKLETAVKTPEEWANYIKAADKDLAEMAQSNLTAAFNKQFGSRSDISGSEAASFFTNLLKNNNINQPEKKVKQLFDKLDIEFYEQQ